MSSYKLTQEEVNAVIFIGYRYLWADIVYRNIDENGVLILDNMACHDLNDAIECEGLPLLDDRSELFSFLYSLEAV
jgi:hypothetical protein